MEDKNKSVRTRLIWTGVVTLSLSVVWWGIVGLGEKSLEAGIETAALCLAALMVGSLVGFLFSSYGDEESATLGKVRDWLIGGVTAITVTRASSIQGILDKFMTSPTPADQGLVDGIAIFYAGLGFFFMYFGREIFLNVILARSRAARDQLAGSSKAGAVVRQFLLSLPPSMLTGADFGDRISGLPDSEVKRLSRELYDDEVEEFLKQAQAAVDGGTTDWDTVSKAAYIYYYRVFIKKGEGDQKSASTSREATPRNLEGTANGKAALKDLKSAGRDGKDAGAHSEQGSADNKDDSSDVSADKAMEWLTRALNMNPLHVELTMKYAEMMGMKKQYDGAVAILERLVKRPEAPVLTLEWLGYYLRFIDGMEEESLKYSNRYLANDPDNTDVLFNIAYVYGRKYCHEMQHAATVDEKEHLRKVSHNREEMLLNLKRALLDQPKMKDTVRGWTGDPESGLECLASDEGLLQLLRSSQK